MTGVDIKIGAAAHSFTMDFLEQQEATRLSDEEGRYVVGILFAAVNIITVSVLCYFVQAMLLHPGCQK